MKKEILIKKGSTLLLKATLCMMGLIVLALCIFALPSAWKGGSAEFPTAALSVFIIVIGLYVTALPFFFGLFQTFKLLNYIDRNMAFSQLSVDALKKIKYAALLIGVIYLGGLPVLLPIAEADDAPGLLIFGFLIACAPIIVSVFAAVLERLLQNAIDMKSENELTV